MLHESFTFQHRRIGKFAAWGVFFLGVIYAATTIVGLLCLKSPQDPISDPFFTIMELLILLMTPLMVVVMIVVHAYASMSVKVYSLTALIFMLLLAGITSSVHFVILTVSRQIEPTASEWVSFLFSFKWPSVAYGLDILAWDWFFPLSMFFAAPVFAVGRVEITVRNLMVVSGVLSLAGLIGVPLADMQLRNIGIIGYGLVSPFIFLLLGIVFERSQHH
ncbi:MAG: hypothetical protein QNJ38_24230 [Prochloraceae cyanobacterium]|nr:hypothetical protein [Prochloraceae cyanobacterium]